MKKLFQFYFRLRGFTPWRCLVFGHRLAVNNRYAMQRGDQIFDYVFCEREGVYIEETVSQIKRPQGQEQGQEVINDFLFR